MDGFAVSQHRRGAGVLFHVELTPLLPNPEITVCTARVTRMTETFWVNTTISEFGIRFRKLQCHVCGNGLYSSTVPLALTSLQEEGANLALTLQEVAGLPVCWNEGCKNCMSEAEMKGARLTWTKSRELRRQRACRALTWYQRACRTRWPFICSSLM
jgi:hypothetical protein